MFSISVIIPHLADVGDKVGEGGVKGGGWGGVKRGGWGGVKRGGWGSVHCSSEPSGVLHVKGV